jgi:hypothetical protein
MCICMHAACIHTYACMHTHMHAWALLACNVSPDVKDPAAWVVLAAHRRHDRHSGDFSFKCRQKLLCQNSVVYACTPVCVRICLCVLTVTRGRAEREGALGGGASEGGAYQTWASHAARSNHRHPVQYSISTVGSPGSAGSGGEAGRSDAAGLSPVPQRGRKAKVRSLWQMALCRARKVRPV